MKSILNGTWWCLPLFLLITFSQANAQLNQYVVLIPTHTTSGPYAGDYDLKGTKLFSDGYIRWGGINPKPISELQVREYDPTGAPDGEGGLFVCYTIEHTDEENSGDRDVVIRRINSEGEDIWNDSISGPVRLLAQSAHLEEHPHVIPAGDGAIIFYEVVYTIGTYAGEVDIAAARVDQNGLLVWDKAVWAANSDRAERIVDAWPDGNGNVILLFERDNNPDPDQFDGDLIATRVNLDGDIGWGGGIGTLAIVAGSPHSEQNPSVAPDGRGGAYIAYELHYTSGSRAGDVDILAQHLTRNGDRLWVDPSNPPVVSSNPKAKELSPSATLDSIGLTVAFEMVFDPDTPEKMPLQVIGVQRLDVNGYRVWNGGDRPQVLLVKHRMMEHPIAVSDNAGSTYVVMEGIDTATGDRDVFAQLLGPGGKQMWGKDGFAPPVFYGPMPEKKAGVAADSYGGLIVVAVEGLTYRLESTRSNDSTIIAQRIDSKGNPTWGGPESNLILTRCQVGDYMPILVQTK